MDILDAIEELEKTKADHESQAAEIGRKLAEIRDRLNGRARKPKSGKFTRRKKGEKSAADVTDLIGSGPDV